MTEMLCSATTKVYWVGVPPMRDARYDSHVSTLNSLVQHTVDHCAKFIPAPQEIRAKDGSFASYLNFSGQSVRIREKDGIHLSMEGAKIFARSLIQELKKGFQ